MRFFENVVLDKYIIFAVAFVATLFIVIQTVIAIASKCNNLTIKLFSKVGEYFLSILISILIFSAFYLHWALLIWGITYFLLGFFNKGNYIILVCIEYIGKKNNSKTTRNLHDKINKPLSANKFRGRHLISHMQNEKRKTVESYVTSCNYISKYRFFPFKVYTSGLIIPLIYNLFLGSQYDNSNKIFIFVLIENYLVLLGILSVLYTVLYLLTVRNEAHHLYMHKKIFKILYAMFSIVMILLVTGVSLN